MKKRLILLAMFVPAMWAQVVACRHLFPDAVAGRRDVCYFYLESTKHLAPHLPDSQTIGYQLDPVPENLRLPIHPAARMELLRQACLPKLIGTSVENSDCVIWDSDNRNAGWLQAAELGFVLRQRFDDGFKIYVRQQGQL